MRLLVTGSGGLIGSRAALRLSAAGHDVVAAARDPGPLAGSFPFPTLRLDLRERLPLPSDLRVDAIVHCATASDVAGRDFDASLDLTVGGTHWLCEQAPRLGARRIVFLSTVQVHGTELAGTIESGSPVRCESPYALNHLLGEETCRMHAHRGLEVVLLRPTNVFGVPDVSTVRRDGLVPACFVKLAAESGRVTLRSSGLQRRNFVSTDDVADAIVRSLEAPVAGAVPAIVAGRWQPTILEIAETCAREFRAITGRDVPVIAQSTDPSSPGAFDVRTHAWFESPAAADSEAAMTSTIRELCRRAAGASGPTRSPPATAS